MAQAEARRRDAGVALQHQFADFADFYLLSPYTRVFLSLRYT